MSHDWNCATKAMQLRLNCSNKKCTTENICNETTIDVNFLFVTVESYNGSVLRLSRLERKQMGSYLCIGKLYLKIISIDFGFILRVLNTHILHIFTASNDVPPAVSKRLALSVHCKFDWNFIHMQIV